MDNISPIADLTMKEQTVSASESHIVPTHEKAERVSMGEQAGLKNSMRVKMASVILALFGLAIIGASLLMSYEAMQSLLLSLAGITVFLIAILFYFVTPSRLVRGDVCDAEIVSSTELVNALLAPIAGDSNCIYMPASRAGTTRLFIPINKSEVIEAYDKSKDIVTMGVPGMNGIFLTPTGSGLLAYVKGLGATFTGDGLEDEIRDVLVNGTELVSRADVDRKADSVSVRLYGLAASPMCETIRQKSKTACVQAGCPICSFVACMVAEGTGKPVMVSDVKPDGKALDITYRLL